MADNPPAGLWHVVTEASYAPVLDLIEPHLYVALASFGEIECQDLTPGQISGSLLYAREQALALSPPPPPSWFPPTRLLICLACGDQLLTENLGTVMYAHRTAFAGTKSRDLVRPNTDQWLSTSWHQLWDDPAYTPRWYPPAHTYDLWPDYRY